MPNVPGRETIGSVRAAGTQMENVLDDKQECLFSFVGHKRRHQRGYWWKMNKTKKIKKSRNAAPAVQTEGSSLQKEI